MTIFSLADHYTVWTKSTIIDILNSIGDKEFQRSDTKEMLIEHLEGYFVLDIIDAADVKALTQIAEAVSLLRKGRKYKRDKLLEILANFQHDMKDKALVALRETPEDCLEFTMLVRIIFTTDPELYAQLEMELNEE